MLEKGADPTMSVYVSDSDYTKDSEEIYKGNSLSIKDFCKLILEEALEAPYSSILTQAHKSILADVFNMVINYPEHKPKHSI